MTRKPILADPSAEAVPQELSVRDDIKLDALLPKGFLNLYECHSYRNAAHILSTTFKDEFVQLTNCLTEFRILTDDIVAQGGNKSRIAKKMEDLLNPQGWNEARIRGDLHLQKISYEVRQRELKSGPRKGALVAERVKRTDPYVLKGVVDGHKIDFVKGRVAFDMEWNSKDQTFDRDLYALRTFYECGLIGVGVLLTRSQELIPLFSEIDKRVRIDKFKSKYGASTTWMGKLTYRLSAGRAGGCPVLVLGIRPSLVRDFDDWKKKNPVIRETTFDVPDDFEDPEDAEE